MMVAAKWPAVDLPGCLARCSRAGETTSFIIQFYRAQQEAVAGSLSPSVCVYECGFVNPDLISFQIFVNAKLQNIFFIYWYWKYHQSISSADILSSLAGYGSGEYVIHAFACLVFVSVS